MKDLILVLLILFGFGNLLAQSPEQKSSSIGSSALQEASNLSAETVRFFGQKKYKEALPLAQKVIEIREKELGKNDVLIAQSYRNLGFIQLQLGQPKEAQTAFENACNIYDKNPALSDTDQKNFVQLLETVGFNQAAKGDFDKAEKKFQRAVELREKINGKDSTEMANSLIRLADLYETKSDFAKALPPLLQALDIKIKKVGPDSDETDFILDTASCVLTKLGREKEAADLENKVHPLASPAQSQNLSPPVQGGVVNGQAISLIAPLYPESAKSFRISGAVQVKVTIDETGKIIRACAIKGATELRRASELAAYASKFSPTTIQGKPVKVTGIIVYNFVHQ